MTVNYKGQTFMTDNDLDVSEIGTNPKWDIRDDELREITNSNNRQNPIDERILKSNHPLQIRLQSKLENFGYYYERKQKEYKQEKRRNKKIERLYKIDNRDLVKANLAAEKEPHFAIKDKEDILFSTRFDEVFIEDKTCLEYLLPYLIQKKIYKIGSKHGRENRKRFHQMCSYYILKLIYMLNPNLKNRTKLNGLLGKIEDETAKINEKTIKNILDIAYEKYKKSKYYGTDSGQRDFLGSKDAFQIIEEAVPRSIKRSLSVF